MSWTVLDAISAALRELGVLAGGDPTPAQDAEDGLAAFNAFVDGLQADRLAIYTITRTTAALTASQASFSVGTGGNINIARPVFLEQVNYIDTSTTPNTEYPLNLLTDDAYAQIQQKALTSTRPMSAYYNPTYPTGTLIPWPIPTASSLLWALYAPAAVAEFAAVTDLLALPPGYRRMITKNLALELAPSYDRQPSGVLVKQARDAMATVLSANTRDRDMSFDPGVLTRGAGAWSIRTGP